jgi:signal transduction histidine kinase
MDESPSAEIAYLAEQARWLVRVRWFVAAGICAAVVAGWIIGFVQALPQLLAVAVVLTACNLFWRSRLVRLDDALGTLRARQGLIVWQLVVDMAALASLLEFAGGMENPFGMMFALPVAVGAMLLPTRRAVALGAVGVLLQSAVVLGQYTGALPHHGLHEAMGHQRAGIVAPLYLSGKFVAGYLVAFVTMLGGVTFLVRSVTGRYRQAESARLAHERVALSREKLARVGEVSAGVAHAVRNPLHGLINSVDLLTSRSHVDPNAQETLLLMKDALGRIEVVTQRLLSLTREAPLHATPTDVDELVLETLKLVSPSTRSSLATVKTELGAPGDAQLDANRFSEALTNVLDNAMHACRAGGVVTVRTRSEEEARVAVEVIDSGDGIPVEDLPKIFDPFFTTKAIGEGTGLGLAIAQRIIEEHGGALMVSSEVHAGTTVRIVVPRSAP